MSLSFFIKNKNSLVCWCLDNYFINATIRGASRFIEVDFQQLHSKGEAVKMAKQIKTKPETATTKGEATFSDQSHRPGIVPLASCRFCFWQGS